MASKPRWGHDIRSLLARDNCWDNEDMGCQGTAVSKPWQGMIWRLELHLAMRDEHRFQGDVERGDWIRLHSTPDNGIYEQVQEAWPGDNLHCFVFEPGSEERIACVDRYHHIYKPWEQRYAALWTERLFLVDDRYPIGNVSRWLTDWVSHRDWMREQIAEIAQDPVAYLTRKVL